MPIDPAQAPRDLNAKLRLEARLRPPLRRAQNALAAEVLRSLSANGQLPDVAGIESATLAPLLRAHYDDVAGVFDSRISAQLPADVGASPTERAAVAAALTLLFDTRASALAEVIAETSARDARRAVRLANLESERLREEGEQPTLGEEAIFAGTLFSRSLRGRTNGIACLETQASAEVAKVIEAQVLAPAGRAEHQWVTQGDDLVRRSPGTGHRGADSQVVIIGSAFTVGGQQLLHPGDTSLGATIDNVAGCRCNAIPLVDEIVAMRRAA